MPQDDEQPREYASREAFEHLLVEFDGTCWWCLSRPATTGEHKFKRSDLAQLMEPGDTLLWGNGQELREIRGKSGITRDRYGVVKFPKSLCESCNNKRSKSLDAAYEAYSSYVRNHTLLHKMPGFNLEEVYGDRWPDGAKSLARYHAKHFGCRMIRDRLLVPRSLREFLDGASDMSDAQMTLITTDSVRESFGTGLSISPNHVEVDKAFSVIESCCLISYVGPIGIRYKWVRGGIPDDERSQFYDYAYPFMNCFESEVHALEGRPRRQGWFARLSQWANRPRG